MSAVRSVGPTEFQILVAASQKEPFSTQELVKTFAPLDIFPKGVPSLIFDYLTGCHDCAPLFYQIGRVVGDAPPWKGLADRANTAALRMFVGAVLKQRSATEFRFDAPVLSTEILFLPPAECFFVASQAKIAPFNKMILQVNWRTAESLVFAKLDERYRTTAGYIQLSATAREPRIFATNKDGLVSVFSQKGTQEHIVDTKHKMSGTTQRLHVAPLASGTKFMLIIDTENLVEVWDCAKADRLARIPIAADPGHAAHSSCILSLRDEDGFIAYGRTEDAHVWTKERGETTLKTPKTGRDPILFSKGTIGAILPEQENPQVLYLHQTLIQHRKDFPIYVTRPTRFPENLHCINAMEGERHLTGIKSGQNNTYQMRLCALDTGECVTLLDGQFDTHIESFSDFPLLCQTTVVPITTPRHARVVHFGSTAKNRTFGCEMQEDGTLSVEENKESKRSS